MRSITSFAAYRNILCAKHNIVHLCPQTDNDVLALLEMMLTFGQTMLCPADTNEKTSFQRTRFFGSSYWARTSDTLINSHHPFPEFFLRTYTVCFLLENSERSDQIQIQIGAPRPSKAVPVENLLFHRSADILLEFPRACVWEACFPYSARSLPSEAPGTLGNFRKYRTSGRFPCGASAASSRLRGQAVRVHQSPRPRAAAGLPAPPGS